MGARLTLDISSRLAGELSRLAEERGTTKAGVLRKGLSLLFAAEEAQDAGFHVGAWKEQDGKLIEREFILPA
ncbi:MAG TPA: hypothetical protein VFY28_01860 [Candidatus Paceibacterota bacterium]|nr:hypothetical protein [Candidatus Paceibacterota bacterium]